MIYVMAASDSDPVKVIFGIIVFVIWALSSLASNANKKAEEEKRRRFRETMERDQSPLPPFPVAPAAERTSSAPQPPVMMRRLDLPVPQRPLPKAKVPQRLIKSRKKVAGPPPLRTPIPLPATPAPAPSPTPTDVIQSPTVAAAQASAATAASLRAWLRPATMRQQFMLTEVLQPPLALRE